MECKQEQNLERCTCGHASCERRGICCDCVASHLSRRSVPACFLPTDVRLAVKDRSFESFAKLVTTGVI